MAITVNGDNATMVGFKFDDGQNNATTKYEDTVVIVNDGRLMFNRERLGLTKIEEGLLFSLGGKLLKETFPYHLTATPNPYELTNSNIENHKPCIYIGLAFANEDAANDNNIYFSDTSGNPLQNITVEVKTKDNKVHTLTLSKDEDGNFMGICRMNSSDTNNSVSGYLSGEIKIVSSIYIGIQGEIYEALVDNINIKPGGLIYYGGTTNTKVSTIDNSFKYALGVSRFTDFTDTSNKGALALNIGTMTVDNVNV